MEEDPKPVRDRQQTLAHLGGMTLVRGEYTKIIWGEIFTAIFRKYQKTA